MSKLISRSGKHIGELTDPQSTDDIVYDSDTGKWVNSKKPVTKLADIGHGFGRVHVYGNNIFCAGNNGVERVYAWGEVNSLYYSKPRGIEYPINEVVWLAQNFAQLHFIDDKGHLYSCGDDDLGSLGDGNLRSGSSSRRDFLRNEDPLLFGPGITVEKVWNERLSSNTSTDATGCVHCLVNDNGTYKTYGWGYNGNGQVGHGGTANTGVPQLLPELDGLEIVDYDSHSYTVMLVGADGSLWGAGYNNHRQLGIDYVGNASLSQSKDHTGAFMSDVIQIKIVYTEGISVCSFALKSDGTVWSCGDNIEGGLGVGDRTDTQYFRQVMIDATTPLGGITRIEDGGRGQIFAFNETFNTVWATGRNHDGVFGDGSAAYSTVSDFARVIQTNVENFWILGRNEAGWITSFWKFIGDDELYAAGSATDYIAGYWDSSTGYSNVLKRVPFANKKGNIINIRYNGAVTTGDAYHGAMALTDEDEIFVWGDNGHACNLGENSITHWQQPILLNDYK